MSVMSSSFLLHAVLLLVRNLGSLLLVCWIVFLSPLFFIAIFYSLYFFIQLQLSSNFIHLPPVLLLMHRKCLFRTMLSVTLIFRFYIRVSQKTQHFGCASFSHSLRSLESQYDNKTFFFHHKEIYVKFKKCDSLAMDRPVCHKLSLKAFAICNKACVNL